MLEGQKEQASDQSKGMSRRVFLKGGAATVVVAAAAGILTGCAPKVGGAGNNGGSSNEAPSDQSGGVGKGGGKSGGPEGPGTPSGPVDRGAAKEAAKNEGRVFGYSGPGNWLGDAPSFVPEETVDAEVVVIGLGHAGVHAALAACEGGAKVVALEAQLESAMSWYGEDVGCFNSQFVQNQGFGSWNLGEIVDEFVTRGGGRSYPDIVRSYVQNSGEALDHMLLVAQEMGLDPKTYTYDNTPNGWLIVQANMDYDKISKGADIYDCLNKKNYPLHPGTRTWVGAVQFMGEYNDEPIEGVAANSVLPKIEQACIEKGKQLGASYRFGSTAQVLVNDDNGGVTGVIAKEDNRIVQINASKGIILCGGDYAGNAEMCWALLNEYMERSEREGGLKTDFYSFMGGRQGDSVKLGCWAGGFIDPAPRGMMVLGGGISGPWGANAMLWLNAKGERFCNEGNITGAQTASARQPEGDGYLVTDAKWMKSVCASGVEHSGPNGGRPQYYKDMIDGMSAIQPGKEGGKVKNCTIAERGYSTVVRADTLDQLADYLGVSSEAKQQFLTSISRYNEQCATEQDDDFGKDASAMIPVNEPPYYGVVGTLGTRSSSPSMVTMSGLMTDKTLNVLNEEYQPIKGLYAAGNSLGGRYGAGYATPCAGNSVGMAVTHGRVAGRTVAAL